MSSSAVVVDLEVDFHNEDETGYVWTWLSEARDPSMIAPERIVVVGDDDAIAMARVVDLVEHENGTIVHVESFRAPLPSTSRPSPAPRSSPPD